MKEYLEIDDSRHSLIEEMRLLEGKLHGLVGLADAKLISNTYLQYYEAPEKLKRLRKKHSLMCDKLDALWLRMNFLQRTFVDVSIRNTPSGF